MPPINGKGDQTPKHAIYRRELPCLMYKLYYNATTGKLQDWGDTERSLMNVPGLLMCFNAVHAKTSVGYKQSPIIQRAFCSPIKFLFGLLKIILISVLSFSPVCSHMRAVPGLPALCSRGLVFRPLVAYSRFKWTILDLLKVMSSTKAWQR